MQQAWTQARNPCMYIQAESCAITGPGLSTSFSSWALSRRETTVLSLDAHTHLRSRPARQVRWPTPGIPALGRLSQQGSSKFRVCLVNTVSTRASQGYTTLSQKNKITVRRQAPLHKHWGSVKSILLVFLNVAGNGWGHHPNGGALVQHV